MKQSPTPKNTHKKQSHPFFSPFLMKKQPAFTLIELMITMAIIAILATAGILAYTGYTKKGRDTARAQIAQNLNSSVMAYAASNEGNPPAGPTEFEEFLASAGETFGGAGVIGSGTLVKDPVGGKEVCLDAASGTTEPCSFNYTAYDDGTYAISYGVEHKSSTEGNFYKTTKSVSHPDAVQNNATATTKYGVYVGSAPFIGQTATSSTSSAGVDENRTPVLVPVFKSKRIDVVSSSQTTGKADGQNCADPSECSNGFCVSQGTLGTPPYMTFQSIRFYKDTTLSKKCRSGNARSLCWSNADCDSELSCTGNDSDDDPNECGAGVAAA